MIFSYISYSYINFFAAEKVSPARDVWVWRGGQSSNRKCQPPARHLQLSANQRCPQTVTPLSSLREPTMSPPCHSFFSPPISDVPAAVCPISAPHFYQRCFRKDNCFFNPLSYDSNKVSSISFPIMLPPYFLFPPIIESSVDFQKIRDGPVYIFTSLLFANTL